MRLGAWITEDKDEATEKAIKLTKAAIGRVRYHSSLEKTSSLGGLITNFEKTFPDMQPGSNVIQQKIQDVNNSKTISVFTDSEVEEILGFFGNFEVKVKKTEEDNPIEFNVGAVVLATGSTFFDPKQTPQYGYGKFDDVLTALEFEKMNSSGKISLKNGQAPKSVAIIHCVGRNEKGYCSEICCLYSLKFARYLKDKIPGVKISHFYSDLCIPGKSYQKFYEQTKEKNVDFIRSTDVEVSKQGSINYKLHQLSNQHLTLLSLLKLRVSLKVMEVSLLKNMKN